MQSLSCLHPDHLFFRFDKAATPCSAFPLVWLNGGIMADTGSEKKDYLFSNQYRYLIYAAMADFRPMVLIDDEDRIDAYETKLNRIQKSLALIHEYVDPFIRIDFARPFFVPCRKDTWPFEVTDSHLFDQQLESCDIITPHTKGGIYLNQISPGVFHILKQVYDRIEKKAPSITIDLKNYETMSKAALFWHDKFNYVELMKSCKDPSRYPLHVPCATIASQHLNGMTFDDLSSIFMQQTGIADIEIFYVKSGMDAAGEVSTRVSRTSFDLNLFFLKKQIQEKIDLMGRHDAPVKLLIQPCLKHERQGDDTAGIGITYNIKDENTFIRTAVIGHVYEDPQFQTFIGGFDCPAHADHVLRSIDEKKIFNLLKLFARHGYRGPINLDAVRTPDAGYNFIYDCNPRIGGSLPGLLLKAAMTAQGHRVQSMLTLGYRGRFVYPDLKSKLAQFKEKGLLYTQTHPQGFILIPSFVRPAGFDLVWINDSVENLMQVLKTGIVDDLSDKTRKDLKGIYL